MRANGQSKIETLAQNHGEQYVTKLLASETERPGFDSASVRKLLSTLYLHLNASDFKELARLADVLKLHGFLPSLDAR